ncbi:MAG: sulfatase-like hydrolase/transferase [Planctomycetales bacterium]|nr:sulfatase-like hydrolase/transferase [Planctomycetales bacterium]
MNRPPNILWICTDQQRWDTIAALGNSHIRTPHVDRLVAEGVAFTHAFCQSTVCTPSRASFLTGRYPRTTRCRQNGQTMPADERLISRIFADHGYACGLAGKQHLASCSEGKVEIRGDDGYQVFEWSHHPQPDWAENAYSQWLAARGTSWEELYGGASTPYVKEGIPAELHQTTWCAERAIAFARAHRDAPWLFSFNCFAPHHPFDPPAEYLRRYDPASLPLPKHRPGELENKPHYQKLDHAYAHNDPSGYRVAGMSDDDQRSVTAAYYAMIEHIDDAVGAMVDALEESGQLENTIVLFMSDHGEMLGDHGIYLKGPHFYEGAVRVPLVLRWPQRFAAGLKSDALVELVDVAPTLLEAAGFAAPPAMQGRSLLGIGSGAADPGRHRDYVYCEYYNAWTHHRSYGTMMRTRDKKIAVYHGVNEGELYDLAVDPDEFDNLWESPAAAGLRHDLLKQAFDASVFTMDPMPPRRGAF